MNILKFFSKKKESEAYPHYSTSSHATTYEEIAKRLGATAQHIYEIAHGKGVKTYDDRVILDELVKAKILK